MLRKDRWRLTLVAVVVIAALASVFPIKGRIHLGLDLKGGAHIVLQAKGTDENPLTGDSVERLLAVLRNRVDQYGVSEPLIQREGQDRVIVDLPGVENPEQALELIGKTALLEFRQVVQATSALPPKAQRENYDSDEEYQTAVSRWNEVKVDRDELESRLRSEASSKSGAVVGSDEAGRIYLLGPVYVGGKDLKDAKATYDNLGRPVVSLEFNDDGSKLFDSATAENVGNQIAIVLDGTVVSAPVVQERISGGAAQISGRFTPEEARNLAIMLRAGALPVPVDVLENRSVGPTLGADSINSGLKAGLIGCALVILFMLLYYRILGIAADIALSVTILILFALLISFKATLTLPGIAGIILTIGMAVDGNILIFERIKEEYRDGKTPFASLDSGFKKAFKTILDANVTTLIAAAVLYYFGSGPIRGFALTLAFGIVASVFSAVLVTRVLLQVMVSHNSIPSLARRK
ncbi:MULTISPECIES: protein translocase subunit SecD [Dethiosulfovibrio]|uniref:Protein translocase subunit SecD n=2 Tax=Dethiosulfovibrio TaxID=47054 RepID=A0ABS9EMN5_9BACT|nr:MULTISPECIES: protein translocase subunit SecD [Dethiosulfovibrio]MCF4112973.1 protein translocase subunit SecD [Dethiosulfovibrio russensis]MCF4141437.1 protein translocase subunit SecD [Dethiosulfovibrio marinus]MCF4144393.1 protein translocase subunit SecD [Dethiosulfovibrio acidaminovorans]